MSKATTTTTRAAEPVHTFEGGVFHGKSYVGSIPGVRPDAAPGTITLEIPYGCCLEAAFAWGRAHVHYTSPGVMGPSIPSRFVLYANGRRPGEWTYLRHEGA